VNEQSLKLLHSYIQGIENGGPTHNASLTFYKRESSGFFLRLYIILQRKNLTYD